MFENLDPRIRKVLNKKQAIISSFNTESKMNILRTAETGNVEALKQRIEYTNLGGDY